MSFSAHIDPTAPLPSQSLAELVQKVANLEAANMALVAKLAEVQPWNRDISQAPKGEVRKVQRGEREAEVHHPVRIIAAGSGGVVTISQWDPKREAWSMFTKDVPPLAWMPWPDHPGEPA